MTFIMVLAIYGLSYALRNLNGPFNVIGLVRNRAISYHIFFYELLTCPYCVGFHCGWAVYLLGFSGFSFGAMIVWALAGSVIVPMFDRVFEMTESSND